MISAIVMAAGESKRMGKLKQLLPLGDSTILAQTIDNLLKTKVSEVIVVLGHKAEEVRKAIPDRPVKVTVNPAYQQGMSTSIVTGLNLVSDKARAVMLALGDQPFVDSQTVNKLVDEFNSHNKGIAVPVYRSRRGHPVIFAISYKDELLGLEGDIGGREIINRHPDDVLEVAVNCEGVCIDIDTEESYNLSGES
jgi:molybdenum cofactor cytidylyltransferase